MLAAAAGARARALVGRAAVAVAARGHSCLNNVIAAERSERKVACSGIPEGDCDVLIAFRWRARAVWAGHSICAHSNFMVVAGRQVGPRECQWHIHPIEPANSRAHGRSPHTPVCVTTRAAHTVRRLTRTHVRSGPHRDGRVRWPQHQHKQPAWHIFVAKRQLEALPLLQHAPHARCW
jgi:hypothetical protein